MPDELPIVDVVKRILDRPRRVAGRARAGPAGHDRRYSLASDKLRELGWEPEVRFEDGVPQTIDWNCDNEWWWGPIRSGEYRECYEQHYG